MNWLEQETRETRKGNHDAPSLQTYHNRNGKEVVTLGVWIVILILTAIPVVNLISLVTLAFFVSNENLRNYGRASLIIVVIPATLFWLLHNFS